MSPEAMFLHTIQADSEAAAPRLVYADWLEEHGHPERAELIRVCEAMRQLPVFADEYWRLKARRNELRPLCPAEWLAATGYDGSRYDPVFRFGIPTDWKGRWRVIREYTERWHGQAMADVGGGQSEIAAVEKRLKRTLSPSVREYIAYAHDLNPSEPHKRVHRDSYTMEWTANNAALSVMTISEGNWQWGIREHDLQHTDPPIYGYYAADDETHYAPGEGDHLEAETLSDFVLGITNVYKDGSKFRTRVGEAEHLRTDLECAFLVRAALHGGTIYEGANILAHLRPSYHSPGLELDVCVHPSLTWERVPVFLWEYARHGNSRGGMFMTEEDRRNIRAHWGGEPPTWLGPAPPPLQGPTTSDPPGGAVMANDEIPF